MKSDKENEIAVDIYSKVGVTEFVSRGDSNEKLRSSSAMRLAFLSNGAAAILDKANKSEMEKLQKAIVAVEELLAEIDKKA